MRYTRKQIITTTVFDDDISDITIITDLLKTFCKATIDIVMEFKDNKTQQNRIYDKVRVRSVNEKDVDILVFQKSFNFSVKAVPFENIISIKLVTEKHNIIAGEDKLSRFDFIDIQEN